MGISVNTLFIIGGGENKNLHPTLLEEYLKLTGGMNAKLVLISGAAQNPDEMGTVYQDVFKSLGCNNVYNITSFSPTVSEFHNEIILYYKNFILTYNINNQRQKIIDSWPGILNDSIANKQWGWKAQYNFKKSFSDYLFSKL